tara:strand:- start:8976 stop:9224 length:249 start_codon:yes stop_codon:yes gene_type:complete
MRGGGLNAKIAKGSKRGLNAEDAKVTQRRREEGVGGRGEGLGGVLVGWCFRGLLRVQDGCTTASFARWVEGGHRRWGRRASG